ncbi:MAG: hypothetical protein ACREMD_07370 [Gemmatimonadota bacterium]
MQAKVRIANVGGQGRMPAASLLATLALLLNACEHDARRAVIVQADTTGASGRASETAPAQGPEVAFLDAESLAGRDSAAGVAPSSRNATAERAPSSARARRAHPAQAPADDADARPGQAMDPDAVRERGGRPPPPVLLPSGRILLPAGTVFAVELRTPIHTATTFMGDRFAARLTQDVAAGGRVVIPAGALVEGRVSHVGSASEPGHIAFIELEAHKVRTTDGRRLRITANVLDVTGQEVIESSENGRRARVVAGEMDGAELSEAARDARATILASILDSIDGRAIVAGSTDREIIIPTGTPFTLELSEALEIPAS